MASAAHSYSDMPRAAWQGLVCPEPPTRINHHRAIADLAAKLLQQRRSKYPDMAERGAIDPQQAENEIAYWSLIAQDWLWIATGEGAPAPAETIAERRETIDASLKKIADICHQREDITDELSEIAELLIAMRWHLMPQRRGNDVYMQAELNRRCAIGVKTIFAEFHHKTGAIS